MIDTPKPVEVKDGTFVCNKCGKACYQDGPLKGIQGPILDCSCLKDWWKNE